MKMHVIYLYTMRTHTYTHNTHQLAFLIDFHSFGSPLRRTATTAGYDKGNREQNDIRCAHRWLLFCIFFVRFLALLMLRLFSGQCFVCQF